MSTATTSAGPVTQWGWDFGLTDPAISSPFPNEANYFSEPGNDPSDPDHWTIAIESENGPGDSAPGPACQSFPIKDTSNDPSADPGVATVQIAPYATASGKTAYSVDLKTDLYDNAQPAGADYFTWYAFGENVDQGGGPLPPPAIAEFNANLLYSAWLPDAGARVAVYYQAYWNSQSFEFEMDLDRQGDDWGAPSGALVQNIRNTPGVTYIQMNGSALGLGLIPGVETSVHIDWASILQTLVAQGVIAAPDGGWANSASQAFYATTEMDNQSASQAGITSLWINGFEITGSAADDPSTTTQAGGDTMFNVVSGSAGTVETDAITGDIVQTLPPTAASSMQFIAVDGLQYGTNLASAAALGLDPSRLLDYNGNHVGATGQWTMLGLASVQPGAAPSYVLVDPATGRWAEVAVQPNGTVNYQANGDNGNTRVVGIYTDPLVASGAVALGSPNDSQTRFLADVEANHLDLLGSVFDQENGGMDLIFQVNNMTGVYLRAILHTDGNIQYANYVTGTQLAQWATTEGIASAVLNSLVRTS
jgi:hypothetical protein